LPSSGSLGYRSRAAWEPSMGAKLGAKLLRPRDWEPRCATGTGGLRRGLSREGLAGVVHVTRFDAPAVPDGRGLPVPGSTEQSGGHRRGRLTFLPTKQVRVDIGRDGHGGVPENSRHDLQLGPHGQHERGRCMPRFVHVPAPEPGSLGHR